MSYTKMNPSDAHGTSFHDVEIHMSFDKIVEKLGKPHVTWAPGDKVQYEWCFQDIDGRPVTVYDWKSYSNKPNEWHVGGRVKIDTVRFKAWFDGL